jgi:hypothetical protein
MRKYYLVIVLSLFFTFIGKAQTNGLYGMFKDNGDNRYHACQINPPSTASITPVSVGISNDVGYGLSTFDGYKKRLIYVTTGDTMYVVNGVSGNIVYKNLLAYFGGPMRTVSIEFNCKDSMLYGMAQKPNGACYIMQIDYKNGNTVTNTSPTLVTPPNTPFNASSLDSRGRLFFVAPGDTLYTMDVNIGLIRQRKKLAYPSSLFTTALIEYNCMDTTLYGVSVKSNRSYLTKLNQYTGNVTFVTPVSSGGIAGAPVGDISTLDPINKRFFFDANTKDTLCIVDLTSGGLVNKNLYNPFNYSDHVIEFDKPCSCLYTDINELSNNSEIRIFPNPFESILNIHLVKSLTNGELILYDEFGKEVLRKENIKGNEIPVQRNNLASGIYFFRLLENGEPVFNGKVVAR